MATLNDIYDILVKIPIENWKITDSEKKCYRAEYNGVIVFIQKPDPFKFAEIQIQGLNESFPSFDTLHRVIQEFGYKTEKEYKQIMIDDTFKLLTNGTDNTSGL